jgi:plastocyanin
MRRAAGPLWALPVLACLAAAPALAAERVVEVYVDGFVPAELTVAPGDTVTWVNRSPVPHEMAFAADPTGEGAPEPRWFLEHRPVSLRAGPPGRYPYRCRWHGLYGVLVIRAPGGEG